MRRAAHDRHEVALRERCWVDARLGFDSLTGSPNLKIAATITFVLLLLVTLAGVSLFWGLEPIPKPKPMQVNLHDKKYADIAGEAAQALTNARAELGVPSLSVAIARNGRLLWTGAIGWQNIEK